MTYSIDIYRREIKPTTNFLDFSLFVSFFPQLVAGPIERARTLLPQIGQKRDFDKNKLFRGIQLIFWGLFKKVFVADNLGIIVDQVYGNPNSNGLQYIIATWAFAFQIYGDFSGYSDIARGTAKCLGFELMHNFRQPYFAVNPSDFWKRWHISLSSWLRDYLYIPLGGNKKGTLITYRNLMLTMLLGGLWHGANWNFVLWGAYHGLLLCVYRMFKGIKRLALSASPNLTVHMLKAFIMFQLTCLGWVFFRVHDLGQIKLILIRFLNLNMFTNESLEMCLKVMFFSCLPLFAMALETIREIRSSYFTKNQLLKPLSSFRRQPVLIKNMVYGVLTYLLFLYGAKSQAFIYFQF